MGKVVKAVASVAVGVAGVVTGNPTLAVAGFGYAASSLLAPKPKPFEGSVGSFGSQQRQRLQTIRSTVAPRQEVYGETVVSGPLVARFSTGTDSEYLHLFICLAGHECEEIKTVWLDETLSTDAKFSGLIRINSHTGSTTQAADSDAVSEITEWTTNHRLRGIAYLYVRLLWDAEVWVRGIPNIKALVKGKKIVDTRLSSSTPVWSDNPILCQRDFFINTFKGTASEIDDDVIDAQANICDEDVALKVTGNITAFADAGGGEVTVTSTGHALSTGAAITISGTTNYNGTYTISNVSTDDFEITATWVSDDATGSWKKAITAVADAGGGEVTISCATHGFSIGEKVTISGTTSYNGEFTITDRTADTFDIVDTYVASETGVIDSATQTRYVCNGAFTLDDSPINIIEKLKSSCAGVNTRQQGLYKFFAGAYTVPTIQLNEDDLRDDLEVQTKDSRKDLFNAVKGEFIDSNNGYLATNFTPLINSTYETEDGGLRIFRIFELPFTDNARRAQRISKIHLQRGRQGVKVLFPAKMTAYPLTAWDTVNVTIDKLDWSSKSFRVLSWSLTSDGGIDLEFQEDVAADWSWTTEEQVIAVPPVVSLVDPLSVGTPATPTGLTATARKLTIELTWTANSTSDISGYDIQSADDSGFTTNLVTLSEEHKGTYYVDDLGTKDTQKYYRIRAVDRNRNVSAYTSGVNATTAGVDTAEIVDNAVSTKGSSSIPAQISASDGNPLEINSVAISAQAGTQVLVIAKTETASSTGGNVFLYLEHDESATRIDQVWKATGDAFWGGRTLVGLYTTTGSGTATFKHYQQHNNGVARNRNMVVMELKK